MHEEKLHIYDYVTHRCRNFILYFTGFFKFHILRQVIIANYDVITNYIIKRTQIIENSRNINKN